VVGVGARSSCWGVTVDTALARFRCSTAVACPVTTTASRLNTSWSRAIRTVDSPAATATRRPRNPILRTSSVTFLPGADSENSPLSSVNAVIGVPITVTLAPATGSLVTELVTFPVIVRCWASAAPMPTLEISASVMNQVRFATDPPYLGAQALQPETGRQALACARFGKSARRGRTAPRGRKCAPGPDQGGVGPGGPCFTPGWALSGPAPSG